MRNTHERTPTLQALIMPCLHGIYMRERG